jgi:hypothetical protein
MGCCQARFKVSWTGLVVDEILAASLLKLQVRDGAHRLEAAVLAAAGAKLPPFAPAN